MSPGQSRLVFGSFALVLAGVTANAMLQSPRLAHIVTPTHNAPAAAAKPDPNPQPIAAATAQKKPDVVIAAISEPVRTARVIPDSASTISLPLVPVADGDTDTIRAIQKELATRNYGPLIVNGQSGPLTQAAIMGWEFDNGAALTGEASVKTLKRIIDVAPKFVDPHARKIRTVEAELVVTKVQHSLTTLGYQPGKIDGRLGAETERAIRLFESDTGIEPTGRISAELFTRLARGMGAKSSATR
jgi:peptidoglycan hydrolase-like protein with peptidoglycan-binding domain